MQLSVCPQPLYARGFPGVLDAVCELGLGALELPVDGRSPIVDLEELLGGGVRRLRTELAARELRISAISNHQEGQLLLGPHHGDTDGICAGSPEQKSAFALARLTRSAELASELEVGLVVGFVGCEDYTRFFPWPDPEGWEKSVPCFQERVGALLDRFDALGVSFAQEPHPKQFVYNLETALESVEHLHHHPRWGFNFDPANLLLAGVDPALFVQELAPRILHVHAKDGELVAHNRRRSGLLAHGPWDRKGRGFRFRIPGWGDVRWRAVVTELALGGFDGFLAIENEDPTFAPEDGLRKAVRELAPLLPEGPRKQERWW